MRKLLVGELQREDREDDADERLPDELLPERRPEAALLADLDEVVEEADEPQPGHEEQDEQAADRRALAGDDGARRRRPPSELPTMTAPPIVGVPRLVWCEVGPSSRMNWP